MLGNGGSKMGYILPINPIQSQQYANRLTMESYNFATINRVQSVKLNPDFQEEFKRSVRLEEKRMPEEEQLKTMPTKSQYNGYIVPNPANLSPAISRIVGKGNSVNTYI